MMARDQFKQFPPFEDHEGIQKQYLQIDRALEDTVPLAAVHASPLTTTHKAGGNLLAVAQHIISLGLTRLQDPQPEGLVTRGLQVVKPVASLGALPTLTLTNTLGLLFVSFSYYLSVLRFGDLTLEFFFFLGLLLMFVPNLVRLLSAPPLRLERICLICIMP